MKDTGTASSLGQSQNSTKFPASLPTDLGGSVFEFLRLGELCALAKTCASFHDFARNASKRPRCIVLQPVPDDSLFYTSSDRWVAKVLENYAYTRVQGFKALMTYRPINKPQGEKHYSHNIEFAVNGHEYDNHLKCLMFAAWEPCHMLSLVPFLETERPLKWTSINIAWFKDFMFADFRALPGIAEKIERVLPELQTLRVSISVQDTVARDLSRKTLGERLEETGKALQRIPKLELTVRMDACDCAEMDALLQWRNLKALEIVLCDDSDPPLTENAKKQTFRALFRLAKYRHFDLQLYIDVQYDDSELLKPVVRVLKRQKELRYRVRSFDGEEAGLSVSTFPQHQTA